MPTIRRSWVREAPAHGGREDPAANLVLPGRAHSAIRCTLPGRYPPSSPAVAEWCRETGPVITVADVEGTPDATLLRMPNFGKKSLRELRAEVDRYLGRGG